MILALAHGGFGLNRQDLGAWPVQICGWLASRFYDLGMNAIVCVVGIFTRCDCCSVLVC